MGPPVPAQSSSGASHYSEEGFESVATASIAESVRSRGSVAESVASSAASAVRSEPPPIRAAVAPPVAAPSVFDAGGQWGAGQWQGGFGSFAACLPIPGYTNFHREGKPSFP